MAESDMQKAEKIVAELKDIFKATFSKNRITYGPKVGNDVRLVIVPDGKLKELQLEESSRLADLTLRWALMLAPEVVRDILGRKYRTLKETFPYPYINERTIQILTREDRAIIRGQILQSIISGMLQDIGTTVAAYYSEATDQIFIQKSDIDAGTLAHEMAHAYANIHWYQFVFVMGTRKMKDTDKLDEGMAIHIAQTVIESWYNRHPEGTYPDTGSGYDKSYTDRADAFIKAVNKDNAFTAFFGGYCNYTGAKPEDSLIIGKKKKKWKWAWR